ncbi:MAG: DUF4296 domain-containing protein [Tenuifilaceae bacterium]
MRRVLRFSVIILLIIITSCRSNDIISKKDIVPILVKISLTDATVASTDYKLHLNNNDTIEYYANIIESFGFTTAQFDSSLKYYSSKPKEFDIIYDNVIFELSKIETTLSEVNRIKKDSLLAENTVNLWSLKSSYEIFLDGPQDQIRFDIPVTDIGNYTLSYDIQIFPDDESINPELKAYFYYDDKSEHGFVCEYTNVRYVKDGLKREIVAKFEQKNNLVTNFVGLILDNYNEDKAFRIHASVSNIKLLYEPFKEKSDLKFEVDKNLKPE